MRKLILSIAVLSAVALGSLGCGTEEQAASGASELVPAGVAMYAEATLKPEGEQRQAIDAILAKFPGGGEAGEKLKDLIEKGLRESDAPVSFRNDIEPWLGDEVAFFARDLSRAGEFQTVAGLVATEDEDKALETLEKSAEGEITRKNHNDVEYLMDDSDEAAAVLDGFLVLGTEAGVKAVIDTSKDGSALSGDDDYKNALEGVSDDRLGLFYLNSPELLTALRQAGTPLPDSYFKKFFEEPIVATVDADHDGVTIESGLPESFARASLFGQGSDLLTELPADSWLGVGQANLGELVEFYIDALAGAVGGRDAIEQQLRAATGLDLQQDVLDWMGDFGVFVRGSSVAELDGALIIETDDEAASGRLLSAVERLAQTQSDGGFEISPRSGGFTAKIPGSPKPVHVFQEDGRVVFAFGDKAAADAVDPDETLGDSAEFSSVEDALGDDVDVSTYVLLKPIFDLVDSTGAASDADWQKAKPYLEPLSALVSGTSGSDDDLRHAFKLVVK